MGWFPVKLNYCLTCVQLDYKEEIQTESEGLLSVSTDSQIFSYTSYKDQLTTAELWILT